MAFTASRNVCRTTPLALGSPPSSALANPLACHGPLRSRDAQGTIDGVPHGQGRGDGGDELVRHVLEERVQIDLLLIGGPHGGGRALADDGHHGLVIARSVVEAVQQMDGAGPTGRKADARAHALLAEPGDQKVGDRQRHTRSP